MTVGVSITDNAVVVVPAVTIEVVCVEDTIVRHDG